jgi:multiple sugar transport system substrate-binding protein
MFTRKLLLGFMLIVLALGFSSTAAQETQTVFRFGTLQGDFVDNVNAMLVEQFQAAHPDIEVSVEYLTGDIAAALAAQAAAGTLPDVTFTADLFVVPFAKGGISIDMEPLALADPEFDLSDVYENMLALSEVEGEGIYMIPSSYDVVTLYYNKTLFEQAGAPLPTPESTWDEIIESCKIILEKTEAYCLPAGANGGTTKWWAIYVPWIVGYGGSVLSEDRTTVMLSTPESLAGLKAYTDIWTVHGVGQPFDFDPGGDCFQVGKCALQLTIAGPMQGVRALDPQPFEWDVEVIPTLPEGKVTGMGTYGFSITANAQDPELAWQFIKGLLSPETQKAIALRYSGMPLLKSMRNDPDILALPGPPDNIEAFLNNGENGITPPYFPGDCGSLYAGQINTEINDAFDAVIIGGVSVEEAFTEANDNIQACLDSSM